MLYRSRKLMALWAGMLTAVACVLCAAAPSASATPAAKAEFYTVAAKGVASVSPAASPNCGKGVGVRKVVATYKAKRFYAGYYYIWTFNVVPEIKSGSIVTAYGSRGKE